MTSQDLQFVVAKSLTAGASTTVLARQRDGTVPHPVARLVQVHRGMELHVSVQRLPEPEAASDRAGQEMAALEQLYALVLRQEPLGRYCLVSSMSACHAEQASVSHAQVLQALAALRERAAVGATAAVRWHVVELQAVPASASDADVIGVRATIQERPLTDLAIYFNRPPHSICVARTQDDGVAACRLQDQDADGDQHEHATTVVATFPGDVRPDRVLLPTTQVLPATAAIRPPASTRPTVAPHGPP